jgi:sec-independent protein translocase protein TatA
MGSFSVWHWLIVALVVLVLFGRGKISETMGDFGRGVKSFRKGMEDEDARRDPPPPPPQVTDQSPAPAQPSAPVQEAQPQTTDQTRAS